MRHGLTPLGRVFSDTANDARLCTTRDHSRAPTSLENPPTHQEQVVLDPMEEMAGEMPPEQSAYIWDTPAHNEQGEEAGLSSVRPMLVSSRA